MIYVAVALFLVAFFLLIQARKRQFSTGLPAGRIIYSDTRNWGSVEKALYDPKLGLTGRPDYLVKQKKQIIPIEVKSRFLSSVPYDGHIFQLAAYCYLVYQSFGIKPDFGILHYTNRTYAIDFTLDLEYALVDLIEEMRRQAKRKEIHRSHNSKKRCIRCGFSKICDEKLGYV